MKEHCVHHEKLNTYPISAERSTCDENLEPLQRFSPVHAGPENPALKRCGRLSAERKPREP